MSEITFLASSNPFRLPAEIEEYNNRTFFEREEDFIQFHVHQLDEAWVVELSGLFSMPYVYKADGVGNRLFLTYIEKYLELGDVLEIYHVPNQHAFKEYRERMEENPEPIEMNVRSLTYRTVNGLYRFHPKTWVDELSHRDYLTPFGITTFLNC